MSRICIHHLCKYFSLTVVLYYCSTPLYANEPVRVTSDGQRKLAPNFLADGEAVIFSAYSVPNRVGIFRLDLNSIERTAVYPDGSAHQFDPVFSRDGRYHVYCRTTGSPQIVLVIKDTKENREFLFTPQGGRSTARGPQITPDSSSVIFTISAPGGQQIAAVDLQGKNYKNLTESVGINCWPAVSTDGKRVAFSSSRDGNLEIYSMKIDGSEVRRLTENPSRDMRPAWSPDGRRIAFTSVRDGNHEIYIMSADGENVIRLTDHPDMDDWPTWHPDGKWLLTVSQRRGKFDLYLWDVPEQ